MNFTFFASFMVLAVASPAWSQDASEKLLMRPSMESGYIMASSSADGPNTSQDDITPMLDLEPAASAATPAEIVAPAPAEDSAVKQAAAPKVIKKRDAAADAPYVPPVKPPLLQEFIAGKQLDRAAQSLTKQPEQPVVQPTPQAEEIKSFQPDAVSVPETVTQANSTGEQNIVTPASPVNAQFMTMGELLLVAYKQNATLMAERERLFGLEENVVVARAAGLPDISANANLSALSTDSEPGSSSSNVEKEAGLTIAQPIYQGGRIMAGIDLQNNTLSAARASYDNTVQTVLLDVVTTAMDVSRNQATIGLNKKNREVLAKQLDATSRGFEVGELTRTDVAQAEARLSGAEASLVVAETGYKDSLSAFSRLLGMDAGAVALSEVTPQQLIPTTLDEALTIAMETHPNIRAAKLYLDAAADALRVAQGGVMPDVSATGSATQTYDPNPGTLDESRAFSGGIRATLPLYKGGALQARIRQAKKEESELRERLEETRRRVKQDVEAAWNSLASARAQMQAFDRQTKAATLARDGVYKEREVGTRTILDTLNADKELLDAEVGLVSSQRDEVVAVYSLLAATGQLTRSQLAQTDTQESVDGVQ